MASIAPFDSPRDPDRAHLFRRIAWRLQAQAEGDLSERARQRAAELANDLDLRLRAPRSFWREIECNGEPANRDLRLPPADTVLERVLSRADPPSHRFGKRL